MKIGISILFLGIVWVTLVSSQATTTKTPKGLPSFDAYKAAFKKQYTNSTSKTKTGRSEAEARAIYNENLKKINAHNAMPNRTYNQGVNQFTDTSAKDFKKYYTGYNATLMKNAYKSMQKPPTNSSEKGKYKSSAGISVPPGAFKKFEPLKHGFNATKVKAQMRMLKQSVKDNLDLSPKMSPVKNQGLCGSCWAFATVALLEYESVIEGTNTLYSEQHLVDCDTNSKGCDGGVPYYALLYTAARGIATEANKPYTGSKSATCTSPAPLRKIPNVCFHTTGSEDILFYILNKFNRPVAAAIHGSLDSFSKYTSGVYSDPDCSSDPNKGDHAIVGN